MQAGSTPWLSRLAARSCALSERWFPDAFVGRMANLQRFAAGEDKVLAASAEMEMEGFGNYC